MGDYEFNPKPDKAEADLRATRANRVFCTDKEHPYRKRGYGYNKDGVGSYTRSSIAHGCAVYACAIDDPRGRFFVRARSQLCNNGERDLSRHV